MLEPIKIFGNKIAGQIQAILDHPLESSRLPPPYFVIIKDEIRMPSASGSIDSNYSIQVRIYSWNHLDICPVTDGVRRLLEAFRATQNISDKSTVTCIASVGAMCGIETHRLSDLLGLPIPSQDEFQEFTNYNYSLMTAFLEKVNPRDSQRVIQVPPLHTAQDRQNIEHLERCLRA